MLVGRSLREVERRIDRLLALVAVAWAAMLVAILAASAVAVSLWRARAEDFRLPPRERYPVIRLVSAVITRLEERPLAGPATAQPVEMAE